MKKRANEFLKNEQEWRFMKVGPACPGFANSVSSMDTVWWGDWLNLELPGDKFSSYYSHLSYHQIILQDTTHQEQSAKQ